MVSKPKPQEPKPQEPNPREPKPKTIDVDSDDCNGVEKLNPMSLNSEEKGGEGTGERGGGGSTACIQSLIWPP